MSYYQFIYFILLINFNISYSLVDNEESKVNNLTYRLPNNSLPISYDLTIKSDIDKGIFNFTGSIKIHVKVTHETQTITLHSRSIEVDAINLLEIDDDTLINSNLTSSQIKSHNFLIISLPTIYQVNDEFILEISYQSELSDDAEGFYRANYTDNDGNLVWFATTHFEPHNARHAMPCYDEPGIRAPIKVTIVHNKRYSAIANMNVESEVEIDDDYVITKFKSTPSIPSYIIGFVISNYSYIDVINTRIPQRIYAKPTSIANGEADFAASIVGRILSAFEDYFGINIPLDKMDHVAIEKFKHCGMENIGLTIYSERELLLNTKKSVESIKDSKYEIILTIAHEITHQYFGNIVSPQWWSYTWLKEGIPSFFEVYIPSIIFPEYNYLRKFEVVTMVNAFESDEIEDAWSMNHYTEHPDKLEKKYNGIAYEKSPCVLRMFQEVLTPPVFAKGLQIYLNQNFMKSATPEDFHEALQIAYDEEFPATPLNIGELMYSWEDQPGYPIIKVEISGKNLTFTQTRFPKSNGEVYSIPLTIATKSNPNFTVKTPTKWLNSLSRSFPQSELNYNAGDWITVNVQQVGYYRVDYSTTLWRALIDQLTTNHAVIDPINRAVLQDEIYLAWTKSERVNYSDVMRILSYLGEETDPVVWEKAGKNINRLYRYLTDTEMKDEYYKIIRNITKPHLLNHGYENIEGESPAITSLRTLTIDWNQAVLNRLLSKMKSYLKFSNSTAESIEYCSKLHSIDFESFKNLTIAVSTNATVEDRDYLLGNLGCSLYEENLKEFLKISIDAENILNELERILVIMHTMRLSELGYDVTIDFMNENYKIINARMPSSFRVFLLRIIGSFIKAKSQIENVEMLLKKLLESKIVSNDVILTTRSDYLYVLSKINLISNH